MNVVVNLAVYQHQMTLQVACNLWVALDAALDSAMPLIEEELDYASVSKLQAYAQM